MKLSILIPCYNEKKFIEEVIERVHSINCAKEIIIIDDGSNDGTQDVLRRLESRVDKIIYQQKNLGKGAAIRAGLGVVTGDCVAIQDADLEYDPNELLKLVKPIEQGVADVVYGSRFVGSEPHRVMFFWHYIGNKCITMVSNLVNNLNLTDVETGYKVFRSDILRNIKLQENGFGFEVEVTAKIAHMHCRIYEMGISYYGRTYEEGKKINWKDGVAALFHILKYWILR